MNSQTRLLESLPHPDTIRQKISELYAEASDLRKLLQIAVRVHEQNPPNSQIRNNGGHHA